MSKLLSTTDTIFISLNKTELM